MIRHTLLLTIAIAQVPAINGQKAPLSFEVASIKPVVFAPNQFAFGTPSRESRIQISGNRVTVQGLLAGLVMAAYQLRTFELAGTPEWRNASGRHEIYVIEAKAPGEIAPTMNEARQMLQTLLAERFQLKFHRETKDLPAYSLTLRNNQSKLKPSTPDVESKTVHVGRLHTIYSNVSMSELVLQVGSQFDRPLFDKTGLTGGYDFTLEYMPSLAGTVSLSPEQSEAFDKLYPPGEAPPLTVALERQLGLRLVASKERVDILMIDHVERPSAN